MRKVALFLVFLCQWTLWRSTEAFVSPQSSLSLRTWWYTQASEPSAPSYDTGLGYASSYSANEQECSIPSTRCTTQKPWQRLRNVFARVRQPKQSPVNRKQNPRVNPRQPSFSGRLRRFCLLFAIPMLWALTGNPLPALAGGGGFGRPAGASPLPPLTRREIISQTSLWFALFTILALLHAAEIAVTTLYPWKVREIAEEEVKAGKKRGLFTMLSEDITRVLTTILVTSTACSIFATTLFTHLIASIFGTRGERYGAIALTALTLYFVELLPKSLGVVNAEVVARLTIPPINVLSAIVSPLGISLSFLAKKTLQLLGVNDKKGSGAVSDSQLRLIVTGARDSGTIDHSEQEMIQGVLNLNDQRVKEIMRPRVEMVSTRKIVLLV